MPSGKPNILMIQADQMTPLLMGAYGHPVVQTPNLDRLVAQGVRFDAAYSPQPVCGPARACMITGKFASNIGAYDNACLLPADQPTLAHYLTNADYDCVFAGKMHFVGPDQLHGFRQRFLSNIYPADFSWIFMATELGRPVNQALNYVDDAIHVNKWNNALSYDEEAQFRSLEYLHARGLAMQEAQAKGETPQPFFLFTSFHHPHEAFWPPQEFWDLYAGAVIDVPEFPDNLEQTYSTLDRWLNHYHGVQLAEKLKNPESIRVVRRAYYALVTYIDYKVGQLLDALQENGLEDNTIIIFTSDHGDMLCERGMVQKRTFYEWSARVPMIIRFPDGRQAGIVRPEPVSLIDLLPTLLDIANVSDDERLPVDGRSLMGLLDGQDEEGWVAISESHADGMVEVPCFMIRKDNFKYIYIHGHDAQLFDLNADPAEWHNLASNPAYSQVEAELKADLLSRFDPDQIAQDVKNSYRRRKIIDQAMKTNGTRWDPEPRFDPTRDSIKQYLG